jgi:hypothetical protein
VRITILLPTVVLLATLAASAQTPSSASAATGDNTLTGCLKGSIDQYYLVEKNGHKHTLQGKNEDLSQYVDHTVTVTGKASTSRVAGSDVEGHGKGYFVVHNISDQGSCKK